MRLKNYKKEAIIETFKEVFKNGEISLFGSRIDDSKKGGNFDLYLKTPYSFEKKIKFLAKLKNLVIEK